ncbi:ATP-dependent sacrificial sulfur transferase LarE [Pseudonocardia acidicola]|uniref:ATP-dependent sacrificial sulfur transferase LarE n=1 Tax=Pseudonocardia acidicola TaxID=2724939 RepID=A0ABX1SIC5_9PSEU|nr:ATP-dependent sacrificial sulfur transferase LarE [Pseudonocardia acidicola]NMI01322.1 ATP-dependent sacrificial sulfur transferase LarE [Pseudonocardia acidicola]
MAAVDRTVDGLLRNLRERLRREQRLLVAFSGGADSALVAAVAAEVLGPAAVAVTAVSASLPRAERLAAKEFARSRGIAHVEVATDELDRPEYVANAGDRCFHCKSALLDALVPLAELSGAAIALGTNVDDLGDHRPGQRAAAARGAIAPLVDVGLTKADVRRISTRLGLSTADKPAAACLSSRVAYGDPVTAGVLARIDAAEAAVKRLGFEVCRVRSHAAGTVARLELPADELARAGELRLELDAAVRGAGFEFCALDLQGFRSGRMNVLLGLPAVTTP